MTYLSLVIVLIAVQNICSNCDIENIEIRLQDNFKSKL